MEEWVRDVHLASAGLDKNAGIGSVRVVADPALCPALTARIRATGGGGVPGHGATTRHLLKIRDEDSDPVGCVDFWLAESKTACSDNMKSFSS